MSVEKDLYEVFVIFTATSFGIGVVLKDEIMGVANNFKEYLTNRFDKIEYHDRYLTSRMS